MFDIVKAAFKRSKILALADFEATRMLTVSRDRLGIVLTAGVVNRTDLGRLYAEELGRSPTLVDFLGDLHGSHVVHQAPFLTSHHPCLAFKLLHIGCRCIDLLHRFLLTIFGEFRCVRTAHGVLETASRLTPLRRRREHS